MAAGESIREVPDSEDELLSSSPIEALRGSADKLSAAARVLHQGAQDALPRVAHHHQENAESSANASEESVEALSADQKNASLDVHPAQRDLLCENDDDPPLQSRPKKVLDDRNQLRMANMSAESHSPQLVAEALQEFSGAFQSQHEVSLFEQQPDMFVDQPDETPRDTVVEPCLQNILCSPPYAINVPLDRVSGLSQAGIMRLDIRPCEISERFNDAEQPPRPSINVASEGHLDCEVESHMMINNAEVLYNGFSDECQILPTLNNVEHGQLNKSPEPFAFGYVVAQTVPHDKILCPSVEVNTDTETKMDSFQVIPGEEHTKAPDDSIPQPQQIVSAESLETGAMGEDRSRTRISSNSTHLENTELAQQPLNTVTDLPCDESNAVDEAQPINLTSETTAYREPPIDSFQHPQPRPSPQEITLAELKAHKAALLSNLASLPAIQVLIDEHEAIMIDKAERTDEPTESDIMAAAHKIVKEHIKLLHQYNELKDAGQGLMGLIADQRGVRIVEVQEEFGIDAKD